MITAAAGLRSAAVPVSTAETAAAEADSGASLSLRGAPATKQSPPCHSCESRNPEAFVIASEPVLGQRSNLLLVLAIPAKAGIQKHLSLRPPSRNPFPSPFVIPAQAGIHFLNYCNYSSHKKHLLE